MGSYAKLSGVQPQLGLNPSKFSLSLQDIYVPDGQIQGHVEPPAPIQQAFGQGWFRLRDANWDPNFPTSAKTIRWFLEKGKEINPDVLIAINLSTIQKLLTLTGNVKGPTLDMNITADNISLLLQNEIQENFFPGSTNKKDLLTATNQAFMQKLSSLPLKQKIKIIQMIFSELKNQEILINATDPKFQAWLEKKNWAGVLQPAPCTSKVHDCLSDTVAIIESNLGSNKANAFITRHTTHKITKGSSSDSVASGDSSDVEPTYIHHQITIKYTNTSPSESPDPPNHHGGDYLNYLRLYIPTSATNIKMEGFSSDSGPQSSDRTSSDVKPVKITTNHDFTEVGFFHTTPHQATSSATISYQLPLRHPALDAGSISYQLTILKQPGITSSPQTINLFGKQQNLNLTTDFSQTSLIN